MPQENEAPKKIVLVVDDRPENLQLLEHFYTFENHDVVTAENGKVALEILNNQHVDIIISDILMPEMDGYQFCMEVKKRWNFVQFPLYS